MDTTALLFYRLYGRIVATNFALPNLLNYDGSLETPDLTVLLDATDPSVSAAAMDLARHIRFAPRPLSHTAEASWLKVYWSANKNYTRLEYEGGLEFTIDLRENCIWIARVPDVAIEYVVAYLLNPVIGYYLRNKAQVCVHASAVNVMNRAVLFVGPSGSGKSTTASLFAAMGHSVLADDVSLLVSKCNGVAVQPAYPGLRLLTGSADALIADKSSLRQLAPGLDKYYVNLAETQDGFHEESLTVGAVYIVKGRSDSIAISSSSRSKSLVSLMNHTYGSYLTDNHLRNTDFAVLSRLVESTSVRNLTTHYDLRYLPELYTAVLTDLQENCFSPLEPSE